MSRNISKENVYQREWLDKLLTSKKVFYLKKEVAELTYGNPMMALILAYILIEKNDEDVIPISIDNIIVYAGLSVMNTRSSRATDDIIKILNKNRNLLFENIDDEFEFSIRNRAKIYILAVNMEALLSNNEYKKNGGKITMIRTDMIAKILCNNTLESTSRKIYDLLQMYFYLCVNIKPRYGKYENDIQNKPIAFITYYAAIANDIKWTGDENIENFRTRIDKISRLIGELKKLNIIDIRRKNGYAVTSNGIKENQTIITFHKNVGDYNPITRKRETVSSKTELDNAIKKQEYFDNMKKFMTEVQ